MSNYKDDPDINVKEMEEWLESLFLDPLTSYLDEREFRIDIFETGEEYIIEALLTDFRKEDITILLKEKLVEIQAKSCEKPLIRNFTFPFLVTNKNVHAVFSEGILEVMISKCSNGSGHNRQVSIS